MTLITNNRLLVVRLFLGHVSGMLHVWGSERVDDFRSYIVMGEFVC